MLGLLGGLQAAGGIAQAIIGGRQAKKAQRALENLQTPTTTSSASINDYYNRASANPYETSLYRMQQQNINRGAATGLAMLQDRRSALGGISSLIRAQNDGLLRAGASAEQQQLGMLGSAARMKSADDERVFNINKMMPFQKQYSLLSSKAMAANQMMNAGVQNAFAGIGTLGMASSNNSNQY